MLTLLENEQNLCLLENLVSGKAVSVNLSVLSRSLGKHRNTIKKKIDKIFDHAIVDRPAVPFRGLSTIYPLFVVVQVDLPNHENIEAWVKEDPYIFAAFKSRQGDYNTLLFVYHESITSYQRWIDTLPAVLHRDYGISDKDTRLVVSTSYFSNQLMLKQVPSTGIVLMDADFRAKGELVINGYALDELDLNILKCLLSGRGIKINHQLLSLESGLHRRTVEKRLTAMYASKLISPPVCHFPSFFVPPNYILTYSLFEIKKAHENVLQKMIRDPCIPVAIKIVHEKYNLLLFGNHHSISDHLRWEEAYRKTFPDTFGSAHITYLSPEMTISFNHQIVSLCIIRNTLERLRKITVK